MPCAYDGTGISCSGTQLFAPLGSACINYGATAAGCHAGSETVSPGAFQAAGLKSAFHVFRTSIKLIWLLFLLLAANTRGE